MSRKALLPQRARHVLIYDEDWDWLQQVYGRQGGAKPIGTSVAIRTILHAYVKRARATEVEVLDSEGEEP